MPFREGVGSIGQLNETGRKPRFVWDRPRMNLARAD